MLTNSLHHWCIIGIKSSPNNKSPLLATQMQELGNTCRVVLQWIPTHCGIPDRQRESRSASQMRGKRRATNNQLPFPEKNNIVKTALKPRQEKDAYRLLDRPSHAVLARLRSGHNRFNAHMYRKLKFVPCPTCPCGEEDQTTEHVLQRCNRNQPELIEQWPSATSLLTR